MPKMIDVKYRHGWIGRAGAAALLLLGAGWAVPAAAADVAPTTRPVTSSLLFPLPPGSIFTVSPGPCMPAGDMVSLTGEVHVVTLVRQGVLTEVHLNLAGIQGTGQTGNLYIGTGAQKFSNIGQPVGPGDTSLELNPIFTLEHTDGCAADQPQVNVTLNFGPGGELLARSFISAGWNNGPALIGLAPDAALPAGGLRALAVELPR